METTDWANLSDEELLEKKIAHLGLKLEGTELDPLIKQLYDELTLKGLAFHPKCHVGDEWFVPVGIPAIFVPFFLAHERLRKLERKMMLEVEGETPKWFMKLIRHEAAHAYAYAYQVFKKRRWQRTFGRTSPDDTPQFYRPRPYSRSFVVHLDDWYAQSHPDEDFAETFAVWLRPRGEWRKRYKGWPALRKLEYVDELMSEIANKQPPVSTRQQMDPVRAIRKTLAQHYEERKAKYTEVLPEFYDRDLHRIFSDSPSHRNQPLASAFLRRNRREIRQMVAKWTGEYEFTLDVVLGQMMRRSRELRLRAVGGDRQLRMDFAVLLTVQTMHFLYTEGRRDWIAL